MAIMVSVDIPGLTSEQDDATVQEMGGEQNPPPGAIIRVAGPVPGGWRIVSVWESKDAFDRFRREKIEPMVAQRGMPMPEFQLWQLHSVLRPLR